MAASKHLQQVLRQALASQVRTRGRICVASPSSSIIKVVAKSLHAAALRGASKNRPDLAYLVQEVDQANFEQAATLLHTHRARPSALHPLCKAVGTALGITTAIAPPLQATVHAAVSDALSELYEQHLRDLHQKGLVRPQHPTEHSLMMIILSAGNRA